MSATVTIFEAVDARDLDQVVAPRHGAVFLQDFANDAGRLEPRKAREIDRALGLSGAHQHATLAGAQRIDVARRDELGAVGVLAHRLQNRRRAVLRRDSGAGRAARGDRSREGGAERRLVVADHHAQAELLNALGGHRQANQSAAELRHEVDRLGRGLFRRHAEVALVLAIFVIHQDDHAAAAGLFERFFD